MRVPRIADAWRLRGRPLAGAATDIGADVGGAGQADGAFVLRANLEEARRFARALGARSSHEWERWSRGDRPDLAPRPADIPGVPYVAYAKHGWLGWRDFLGTAAERAGR